MFQRERRGLVVVVVVYRRGVSLTNSYSSPNIIMVIKSRRMRWVGQVSRMGDRNAYNILVGKSEAKRPLGRSRSKWEDNIKNVSEGNRVGNCELDSSG
jgi:hypothetical protein